MTKMLMTFNAFCVKLYELGTIYLGWGFVYPWIRIRINQVYG